MDRTTDPSVLETVLSPPPSSVVSSSSAAEDEGRFAPGALLGGRYRIFGLLGRGGMGEVYRATDLTLGQSVALKFLPEEASQNPRLLERFHGEVRIARLVSHPNVCRVFDIGEVNGTPFLSMEYVDGEDLACLLTRIGRLPSDKALEFARKLCAGLAAAHDRGVIHRDLKPQNIMINKRGEVLIMDFGLAAVAQELNGVEAHSGTPAYMSPEQLKGEGVTTRSDIYALGLVLYELFTGRKPFEAQTLQQLMDLQESVHFQSMTSVAADIDPGIEKVIRRCLAPDPQRRPATALAVSAALPGGDPLAAALAAGETPSPEVVAAAGVTEGLARKFSVPCLIFVFLCIAVAPWNNQRSRALNHAALDESPDVLAHKSREIAASLGYTKKPADSALWLNHRGELVTYLRKLPKPHQWDEWLQAEAPIQSVYRESPKPLSARPDGRVEYDNPPFDEPGMTRIVLDGRGKLHFFQAAPYHDSETLSPAVEASTVFRAAGLDLSKFQETTPTLTPVHAASEVRAWKGPHPILPNTEVKVQMATWKGRVTEAAIEFPWSAGGGQTSSTLVDVSQWVGLALLVVGSVFGCLLARRNWKRQRSDRQGALRVACARFILAFVGWLGVFHPAPGNLINKFGAAAANCLYSAAVVWILYLALEPAVRARWPHAMVTWNRLLAGRWGDAQVGAHVLIGAAVGCFLWQSFVLIGWFGNHGELQANGALWYAMDTRHWISQNVSRMENALYFGLFVFFVIFGFRRLLRFDILAALGTAVAFTVLEGEFTRSSDWRLTGALFVSVYAILIFVLLRFGLVALLSALFFANSFDGILVGSDWSAWFTPYSVATMLVMAGIALVAFARSLGNRELISGEEESPVVVSRAAA